MHVEEHTIELDSSPVFVRTAASPEEPSADPAPVLFLHTLMTSSDDFLTLLPRTGGVAPDLPGFGRSGKAGNLDYSLAGQGDFVAALLDHMGLDSVSLLAHGFGAGAALTFARSYPQRATRLVIVDGLPLDPSFTLPRTVRLWRTPLLGELVMGSTTRWMLARALARGSCTPVAPERVTAVWDHFDQGTQRAVLRLARELTAQRRRELSEAASGLNLPSMVMWGVRDPWFASGYAQFYADCLGTEEVEIYEQAGHWPWIDEAGAIERIVSFLGSSR
ncbi:MAG: alpha/beta fold hydrolase [Solirubrobacteraceae bacterium]